MSLSEKINEMKSIKAKLVKELEAFVKDKTKSLDERWTFFIKNGEDILEPDCNMWDWRAFDKFELGRNPLMDEIYSRYERHEIVKVGDILEHVTRRIGHKFKCQYDKQNREVELTQEDVNNFKEECIQHMLISFELDW